MFAKHILVKGQALPPIDPGVMYEFVIAGNGVFIRARRPELEAMIPVSWCEIRGLPEVEPYVRMTAGQVPLACTRAILDELLRDLPDESLVWLTLEAGVLRMIKPPQVATASAVHPVAPYDPRGASAFLDIHSHNSLEPFFSTDDDKDETGFRIFAVFGRLDRSPCVTARIGIYGYYWRLDAEDVFDLPDGVQDALEAMLNADASAEKEVLHGLTPDQS